jgi:hypothetical protein
LDLCLFTNWGVRGAQPPFATDLACEMPMVTDNARRTGPAVEKTYQFVLWLIPTVQKFPKSQKFLLGDRIQTTALNVLEGLIEATYTKARRSLLSGVNVQIEKLRFLFRLSVDLRYLDLRRYEFAARNLDEIGRLVGGWLRADRAAPA